MTGSSHAKKDPCIWQYVKDNPQHHCLPPPSFKHSDMPWRAALLAAKTDVSTASAAEGSVAKSITARSSFLWDR
eukprot:8166230-Pyramimonas_sp.AAC.1